MKVPKINPIKNFLLKTIAFIVLSVNAFSQIRLDTNTIIRNLEAIQKLETNNIDSAFQLTVATFKNSQKLDFKRGVSGSLLHFGNNYLIKGKSDSAILYYNFGIDAASAAKDYTLQAVFWKKISQAYRVKGKKDSTFFSLFKSLSFSEAAMDSLKIGSVYNDLGELNSSYGDYKSAINYLSKAQNILMRKGDSLMISLVYLNYGIVYYNMNLYDKALSNFLKAKSLHESLKHIRYLANDQNFIGLCYEELRNHAVAKFYFNQALQGFTKLHMTDEMAEVLFNIGASLANQNKIDSSIIYFEKTLLVLRDKKEHNMKLKAFRELAYSQALKGNYLKAYEYHVKFSDLNDSLLDNEKVKQIAEMQTKYDTEKKEQQITLLGEQNKTKTAQRNALIAGTAVLLILFLASGIYFIQRNRIAKKNEQIAREEISGLLKEQEIKSYNAMIEGQEEERKRIATDLHDRLGSMLSTVKLLFNSLDEKIDKNQEENRGQYTKATGLLDEAVLEVRRISHNLSTGMVNTFGLVPALEELCQSIDNSKIIKCKLLCYGMEARLDQQTEIGLFRIVQELVNNVLKHADAKLVTIQLNRTSESLNLTVEDDGKGFDLTEKMKSNGMGLKNLEARAAKLNGAYHVDSKPGRGTISIIEVPLNHDSNTHSG